MHEINKIGVGKHSLQEQKDRYKATWRVWHTRKALCSPPIHYTDITGVFRVCVRLWVSVGVGVERGVQGTDCGSVHVSIVILHLRVNQLN